MEIINFCLSERGMSAQTHTYTGYRTADGIHLEYYIGTDSWDGDGYADDILMAILEDDWRKIKAAEE